MKLESQGQQYLFKDFAVLTRVRQKYNFYKGTFENLQSKTASKQEMHFSNKNCWFKWQKTTYTADSSGITNKTINTMILHEHQVKIDIFEKENYM